MLRIYYKLLQLFGLRFSAIVSFSHSNGTCNVFLRNIKTFPNLDKIRTFAKETFNINTPLVTVSITYMSVYEMYCLLKQE